MKFDLFGWSHLDPHPEFGCDFLFAIALASLKLLPARSISGGDGKALGVSGAVTAYKSYEKASKSSTRKMRAVFRHAGLRTAENTKQIANEIGYATKLERLSTSML